MGLFDTKSGSSGYEQTQVNKNLPNYVTPVTVGYFNDLNKYMESDPNRYITPINQAQMELFGGIGTDANTLRELSNDPSRLFLGPADPSQYQYAPLYGGADPYYQNALTSANNAVTMGSSIAPAALPDRYGVTNVADLGNRGFVNADIGILGNAAKANYTGYNAPQLGNAQTWQGTGYDAALVGDISRLLNGNAAQASSASLLDNLSAYQNPFLQNVVDATMADFTDYAGQQRAELARKGAAAGAFGEGRFGLAEGQLEGELARARATTDAGLRSDAFQFGANLSNLDAARRQEVALANAGWSNERDLARADLGLQGRLADTSAINASRSALAAARNQAASENTLAANTRTLNQANFNRDAAKYLADASNQSESDYAAALNDFAKTRFGEQSLTNRANAETQNQAIADTFAARTQAAQQDATAQNAINSEFFTTQADLNKSNADLALRQADLQRLNASNLADIAQSYGQNTRADIEQKQALADYLWQIQQQRTLAPLTQLQTAGGLIDPALINAVSGQSIDVRNASNSSGGGNGLGIIAAGLSLL